MLADHYVEREQATPAIVSAREAAAPCGVPAALPDWRLDGPMLVRLAALPVDELDSLVMSRSLAWRKRIVELEAALDAERRQICDGLLYDAAHGLRGPAKSALVALKRNIFNRRALRPIDWSTVATLQRLRDRRRIRCHALRIERLACWRNEARQVFTEELSSRRQRLQQLLATPEVLRGLQLHSATLVAQARKLLTIAPAEWRKGERNTEATLLRYLARASVKTSPFGRWGHVGVADCPAGDGTARPSGLRLTAHDLRIEVHSRLNLALCARIAACVHEKFDLASCVPLLPNPTRFREGENVAFFAPAVRSVNLPFTRLRSGRLPESVEKLFDILEASRLGPNKAEWVECALAHPALGALGRSKIAAIVDHLQQSGLAHAPALVPADVPDVLRRLAGALRERADDEAKLAAEMLCELESLGVSYARLSDVQRDTARLRIGHLCRELGVVGAEDVAPVIEDSVVHGLQAVVGTQLEQSLQRDLGPLLGLYARRDSDGLHQRMLLDIFVAGYGVGGRCAGPARFAAQVMRYCERHAADDAQAFPRFTRARLAHERVMAELAALCTSSEPEVELRDHDLQRLSRLCPPDKALALPRRLGVLLQVAAASPQALSNGDFDLILNQTLPGWGRFFSRYTPYFPEGALAQPLREILLRARETSGRELLELQTAMHHNAHVRSQLTPRAIAMPGEATQREDALAIDRFAIEHVPEHDALRITCDGEPVHPVYLGCLHNMSLPPVHRVLADALPAYAYQAESLRPVDWVERHAAEHATPVRGYPRIRRGRVIVQRRCWAVDASALPAPSVDDQELFHAYASWQATHGLPDRVFARVALRKSGGGPRTGDHKPVHVDFRSHALLRTFVLGLDLADMRTLIFEEALPDPRVGGIDLGIGGTRAFELQIELEERS